MGAKATGRRVGPLRSEAQVPAWAGARAGLGLCARMGGAACSSRHFLKLSICCLLPGTTSLARLSGDFWSGTS